MSNQCFDIVEYTVKYESDQKRKNERFNSWRRCFDRFSYQNRLDNTQEAAIRLAFFLASWGMFRGSGFLLEHDETIHEGIDAIVHNDAFRSLHNYQPRKFEEVDIDSINALYIEIEEHYRRVRYEDSKGDDDAKAISNTLVTKVMLGTTGCIPAFDEYAVAAIRCMAKNDKNKRLKNLPEHKVKKRCALRKKTIEKLWKFYFDNEDDFGDAQKKIHECRRKKKFTEQPDYPPMKLLDMYLWKVGQQIIADKKAEEEREENAEQDLANPQGNH